MKTIFEEYGRFVDHLGKYHDTPKQNYLHGPVGVAKEAGELLDNAYRYWNYGKPRTSETDENLLEECGDILFYLQMTLSTIDKTIEDAILHNTEKLKLRYPDGYNSIAALARADKEPGQ